MLSACANPCSIKEPTCQELCKCTSLQCRNACEPAGIDYRQKTSEGERYRYNSSNEAFHIDDCSVRCDKEYKRCLERCKEVKN